MSVISPTSEGGELKFDLEDEIHEYQDAPKKTTVAALDCECFWIPIEVVS